MSAKLALACLFFAICLSAPALAQDTAVPDDAKLSALEVKFFAHPYKQDSQKNRAARLESFVFGSQQSDRPITERISRLVDLVKVEAPIVAQEKRTTISKPSAVPSTYPRICELEQEVFDRTFENEPVRRRLDRLEIRVLGKRSESTDLALRADILKYSFFDRVNAPRVQSAELVSFRPDTPKQQHFVSVVDKIESLETLAFGTTHPNKRLEQRVAALEQHLCGAQPADTSMTLTMRVSQLLTKVRASAPAHGAAQS